MPAQGYAGGLAFELPQNRYITGSNPAAAAPEAVAQPFSEVPGELAQVEGLTDQYINTRSEVERYVTDMQKKYGIDVTVPKLGEPGGGTPFKTYQKLATLLLITANDLKVRRETQKQLIPQIASGNIRGIAGADLTAPNAEQQFYSTKLLPEVQQANEILKTAVYTEADQRRFKQQVADPLIARLTEEMGREDISPTEKEFLRMNINALVQQPKTTPYAYFQDYGRSRTKSYEVDYAKKVTNIARGKWGKDFTVATDEAGDPVFLNKSLEGTEAGTYPYTDEKGNEKRIPRVIDAVQKKSGNRFFLTFKRGEGGQEIPPLEVTDMSGDELAALLIGSNPKHGDVAKMYAAMRELGLSDKSGSLIEDNKVLAGKDFDTGDPSEFAKDIATEKERIVSELQKKTSGGFKAVRETATFDLPDGTSVTFKPNRIGTGWYISDGDWSGPENQKPEDIVAFLAKHKYFDQFLPDKAGGTLKEDALDELKKGPEVVNKGGKKAY